MLQKGNAVQEQMVPKQTAFSNLAAWGPHAHSFFAGTLHASFQDRLSAAQALDHPFLAPTVTTLRLPPLQL